MWSKKVRRKGEVELVLLLILHYEKFLNLYRVLPLENQVRFTKTNPYQLLPIYFIFQGGCEPSAESPLVLHKHVYGEQRRLHVIENTLNDDPYQSFNMTLEYTNINGPEKGGAYLRTGIYLGKGSLIR